MGTPLPEMIQDKVELLKLTKVAIWDVYASGYREKSSEDKNIKEGILNDIPKFLKENSNIKRIGVSGEKAYEAVKQEFPTLEITYLPSTSGTNNKQWSMGDKTRKGWVEWRKFIES